MNIWQRGTSVAIGTGNSYTADRWSLYRGVTGGTVSRQATSDTTNLPNIQYCARVQRDSGNTNTSVLYFRQTLETLDSIKFAGRQVALSFYARKGSNFSAASDLLRVYIGTGTGTDQSPISFTGEAANGDTNVTLTSTWQRFTITATLPTNTTEIYFNFSYTPVGTASTNDFFEITGVQFELGQVASPYKPMSVTLAGEFQACQRYYQRYTASANYSPIFPSGYVDTSTSVVNQALFPVKMRTKPSSVEYANARIVDAAGSTFTISAIALTANVTDFIAEIQCTVTGATGGRYCYIQANNNAGAYVGFSAELQKMSNIQIIEAEDRFSGEVVEHVIIDRGNGEYTSMPKAVWDEQQKAAELGGTL